MMLLQSLWKSRKTVVRAIKISSSFSEVCLGSLPLSVWSALAGLLAGVEQLTCCHGCIDDYNLDCMHLWWGPVGSPSHGGDVAVYVLNINQLSLPTRFHSVLVSISVFMALSTVFYSIIVPTTLRFCALFFQSWFCLICPFNYSSHGLTFTWWGCYGLCLRCKPAELAHSFYSVLVSVSVFMALLTVFHSINSPDNSLFSRSVLLVLFLPY